MVNILLLQMDSSVIRLRLDIPCLLFYVIAYKDGVKVGLSLMRHREGEDSHNWCCYIFICNSTYDRNDKEGSRFSYLFFRSRSTALVARIQYIFS